MNDSKSQKNEVVKNLFERKSVRIFEDRPISPEDRLTILQAACQAPTAGNQQLYTILEITEPALKKRLSVTCDNQPFIADVPLVLLFCADCQKWYDEVLSHEYGSRSLTLAIHFYVLFTRSVTYC